jgi:hypothetical protein
MKNKTKLFALLSSPVILGGVFSPLLFLNQCGDNQPDEDNDPSNYVGNDKGTNWKGYTGISSSSYISAILFYDDGTASITNVRSYEANNLIIPNRIINSQDNKPYTLTTIDGAFKNINTITGNLTIPNTVKEIGRYAFEGCINLNGTLTIGNNVTSIGDNAFDGCSGFTGDLIIPNSVTSIGDSSFKNCTGFNRKLTIGNKVAQIKSKAFENCANLTGQLIIPNNVISIGISSFQDCTSFTSIFLGNKVNDIGSRAFYNCIGLIEGASDDFPNNKISCSSNNVYYLNNDEKYYCLGKSDNVISSDTNTEPSGQLTLLPKTKIICNEAFEYCSALDNSLTIPSGVTDIGFRCFSSCSNLTSLSFTGSSLININEEAFVGCSSLTGDLVIPDNVENINPSAFKSCGSLNGQLKLGSGLKYIGGSAFYGCSSLNGNLTIPDNITSIEENTFCNCSSLSGDLIIPNSVTSIGTQAFKNCPNFTAAYSDGYPNNKISCSSDNVYYIKNGDTYYCLGKYSNVTDTGTDNPNGSLNLNNKTKIICGRAFDSCNLNSSLNIPSSVIDIGTSAFNQCTGLTGDLNIPSSVKYIGSNSFLSCKNLNGTLTIPNSVINLENYAFVSCSSISSINLTGFSAEPT